MTFLFDLISDKILSEKEFEEKLSNYPAGSFILVSSLQKQAVAGFAGNSIRFIDGRTEFDGPFKGYVSKYDILTYDTSEGPYMILSAKNLMTLEKRKFELFGGKKLRFSWRR